MASSEGGSAARLDDRAADTPALAPGHPAVAWRARGRPLMGTLVTLQLPASLSEADWLRASEAAFDRMAAIERAMSFHDPGSDLRALARAPAGTELAVSPDTWQVLRLALEIEALSDGVFNAAIAPLLVAQGLLPEPDGALPPQARTLSEGIELTTPSTLRVRAAVWVDLGGIAKGHAVDCAVEALQALGVEAGLVNAGGDMRAFGTGAHPVHLRFATGLKTVALLHDSALAASCNAHDSAPSPHIDPRRGRGVRSSRTVVVHAPRAALADALTKVAMLHPSLAQRLCHRLPATQWRSFDYLGT